ncbi:PilZ domain-containing protein [Haliea sp.]
MDRERREYYRINDILPLCHTAAPDPGAGEQQSGTQALLARIDAELNDAINHVFRADPVTAQALGLLNRKLTVLGSMLPGQSAADTSQYVPTAVSLSGSGIAFDSSERLPTGARRRISLLLQPSQVPVQLDGTVLASEPGENQEQPYRVRLDFDRDELAQEQIIRYVVQRQAMPPPPGATGERG